MRSVPRPPAIRQRQAATSAAGAAVEAAAAARAAANEATGCLMSQSQPSGPTHALSLDTINQLGAMPVHRSGDVAPSAFSTYADVALNTSTG